MIDPAKFYKPMPAPSRVRLWLLGRVVALDAFPRLRLRLMRALGY
jgi:hypothetical protein